MKHIYLFAFIALLSFCIWNAAAYTVAHTCIIYGRLLMGLGLLAWMRYVHPKEILSRLLFVLSLLLIQPPALTPESMFSAHWLAPVHILFSWCAGICVWGYLCLPFAGAKPHSALSRLALICQSAAVVSGMIWAMDAPDWGMLWQWDDIETGSLCMLLTLMMLYRSPSAFWRCLCLFFALWQIFSLYLMPMGHSRHSYLESPVNLVLWCSAVLLYLGVFVYRFVRHSGEAKSESQTQNWIRIARIFGGLSMILVLLASQAEWIENVLLYPCFAIIWCALSINRISVHNLMMIGLGTATILVPAFTDRNADQVWINLDEPVSGLTLAGVRISEQNDCQIYHTEIQNNWQSVSEIEIKSCDHQMIPLNHRDMIASGGIWRLWGLDYQPRIGVSLLKRNITLAVLYEIYLVLLWICWLVLEICRMVSKQRTQRILDKPQNDQ